MPDSPDYNKYLPGSVRFSLQDMGELAVRLGSPVIADRRGEIIYLDNFQRGFSGWDSFTDGTGASVALLATNTIHSSYSVLLKAGTTNSKVARITKYLPLTQRAKLGFEYGVTAASVSGKMTFIQTWFSDVINLACGVRIDYNSKVVQITQDGINWVTPFAFSISSFSNGSICNIKTVVDFSTGMYHRLILNGIEIDLSSYTLYNPGSGIENTMLLYLEANTITGASFQCNLAHVIISANEPD